MPRRSVAIRLVEAILGRRKYRTVATKAGETATPFLTLTFIVVLARIGFGGFSSLSGMPQFLPYPLSVFI